MAVGNNIPHQGWQSALVIAKQATSTTFVTAGSFIEFNSESLKPEREELKLASINTTRDYHKRLIGNESIAGAIEMDLNGNNDGCINLIKQAMGGTLSSSAHVSSAAAYTHTIRVGDMESNAASAGASRMQSLSIGVRKGATNTWQVAGCRINTLGIKAEIGSPVILNADIIGQSVTNHTSIGAAAVSFNNDLPLLFNNVTVEVGDSITNASTEEFFTAFEIELGNNLDGDQRALGSRNIVNSYPGKRDLTVKLTQRFDTLTAHNRFLQNTLTAIKITLDSGVTLAGASVTNSLIINIPQAYWNSNTPETGDVGVMVHEIEAGAIYDSTAAYAIEMTLVNGTASYD